MLPGGAVVTEQITFDILSLRVAPNDVIAYADGGTYTISVGDLSFSEQFQADNGSLQVRLHEDYQKIINGSVYATYDKLIINSEMAGNVGIHLESQAVGPRGSIAAAMDFEDAYTFGDGSYTWRYMCTGNGSCTDLKTSGDGVETIGLTDLVGPGRDLGTVPVVTVVPEPAPVASMVLGLAALVGFSRLHSSRALRVARRRS